MYQIVTVSLGNNSYQFDEDAFAALRRYLVQAKGGLKGDPDVDEILGDLERSIAEKCSVRLRTGKTLIDSKDIGEILGEVGPVAGGAIADEQAVTSRAASPPVAPVWGKWGLRGVHVALIAVVGLFLLLLIAVSVSVPLVSIFSDGPQAPPPWISR